MARPKKYNADYFSHDSDMRNDEKLLSVRNEFGHLGYSVWIMLLESLANKDGFKLEWDGLRIELMAGDFRVKSAELENIISYFERVKLIVIEDNTLYCPNLIKRLKPLLDERERKRNKVIPRNNKNNKGFVSEHTDENPHSKVKESKVKESKSFSFNGNEGETNSNKFQDKNEPPPPKEKKRLFVIPTVKNIANEFTRLCKAQGFKFNVDKVDSVAIEFWCYYNDLDWTYKKTRNKIDNWKDAAKNWHSKEDFNSKDVPMDNYNGAVTDVTGYPISDTDDLPY